MREMDDQAAYEALLVVCRDLERKARYATTVASLMALTASHLHIRRIASALYLVMQGKQTPEEALSFVIDLAAVREKYEAEKAAAEKPKRKRSPRRPKPEPAD